MNQFMFKAKAGADLSRLSASVMAEVPYYLFSHYAIANTNPTHTIIKICVTMFANRIRLLSRICAITFILAHMSIALQWTGILLI